MDIQIQKITSYKNDDTLKIVTNKGTVFIDGRKDSNTIGELYDSYPKKDDSNIIKDDKLKELIYNLLEEKYNE